MDKENPTVSQKKKSDAKLQLIFSAILVCLVSIIELYIIIQYPSNYIAIGGFAVIALAGMYIFISSFLQIGEERELKRKEEYENIIQKKNEEYQQLAQKFDELSARFDQYEKDSVIPTDNIINAQKSIAKVSISKNKENTEALLNSNDLILDKLENFEKILQGVYQDIIENQNAMGQRNIQEISLKQQELELKLKEMELEIKDDFMQTMKHMPPVAVPIPQPEVKTVSLSTSEPVNVEKEVKNSETVEILEPEPVMESEVVLEEIQPEPATESEAVMEEVQPEPVMELEEVPESEVVMEEVQPEPVMESEEVPEPEVVMEEVQPEPVIEEKPPMPDLSDPNKIMKPEEIAALIANM